jgi:hypothetical protein
MEPEIPQNVGVTKSVIAAAVFGLGWILQLYWSQLELGSEKNRLGLATAGFHGLDVSSIYSILYMAWLLLQFHNPSFIDVH